MELQTSGSDGIQYQDLANIVINLRFHGMFTDQLISY